MIDTPSEHYLAGQMALEVLRHIPPLPDNSHLFHDGIEAALRRRGFVVRREAEVSIRESGRGPGRIDLLAQYHGGFVALELDNRSPRSKSIDKLRAFNAFRIVVMRGAEPWSEERGIDAIISVPVIA